MLQEPDEYENGKVKRRNPKVIVDNERKNTISGDNYDVKKSVFIHFRRGFWDIGLSAN